MGILKASSKILFVHTIIFEVRVLKRLRIISLDRTFDFLVTYWPVNGVNVKKFVQVLYFLE